MLLKSTGFTILCYGLGDKGSVKVRDEILE